MKLNVFFTAFALTSALCTSVFAKTEICPGLVVYGYNGNHMVGVVVRTFEDERAEVRWTRLNGDYYSGLTNFWKNDALWAKANCSSDGRICVGNSVYGRNGNHIVGTVKRVFENDRVEVRWAQLNGTHYAGHLSYWPSYALAREGSEACPDCAGQGEGPTSPVPAPPVAQPQDQDQLQTPAPAPAPEPAPAPVEAPAPQAQQQQQQQGDYQYQDQENRYSHGK